MNKLTPIHYEGFFDKPQCQILNHIFISQTNKPRIDNVIDYGNHGFIDLLLDILTPTIEDAVGESLVPTYSFGRKYFSGSRLIKHTDRPSCVYTVSITLEVTGSALSELKYELDGQPHTCSMGIGDMVILKGISVPHWRDEIQNGTLTQVFLHYVPKKDEYSDYFFDGREKLKFDAYTSKLLDTDENLRTLNIEDIKQRYFIAIEEALKLMAKNIIKP